MARTRSGREHPESHLPYKVTRDELGNDVTEHGKAGQRPGERQDVGDQGRDDPRGDGLTMAWANSGLYPATIINSLSGTGSNLAAWNATTNYVFLTSNSDSTLYAAALGGTGNIYASTYEVHDSSGWPAGGVLVSAAAAGSHVAGPDPDGHRHVARCCCRTT